MGFFRQIWDGRKLANSLLSGTFDNSAAGIQFASWFAECPEREEQRKMFVQLTLGLRCPSGVVAERLSHCIAETWRVPGARFGDLLAREVGGLITFDQPTSPEQVEQQNFAKRELEQFMSRLRLLDNSSL
jgi:hypothetical protein